jgi:hypothetical protein
MFDMYAAREHSVEHTRPCILRARKHVPNDACTMFACIQNCDRDVNMTTCCRLAARVRVLASVWLRPCKFLYFSLAVSFCGGLHQKKLLPALA